MKDANELRHEAQQDELSLRRFYPLLYRSVRGEDFAELRRSIEQYRALLGHKYEPLMQLVAEFERGDASAGRWLLRDDPTRRHVGPPNFAKGSIASNEPPGYLTEHRHDPPETWMRSEPVKQTALVVADQLRLQVSEKNLSHLVNRAAMALDMNVIQTRTAVQGGVQDTIRTLVKWIVQYVTDWQVEAVLDRSGDDPLVGGDACVIGCWDGGRQTLEIAREGPNRVLQHREGGLWKRQFVLRHFDSQIKAMILEKLVESRRSGDLFGWFEWLRDRMGTEEEG